MIDKERAFIHQYNINIMKFVKSHGLGNDYIVIDGKQLKACDKL